jgi:mannose/fructose/N-acetylgalactosamine-specific phosphotransferase system component IIC
MNVPLMLLAALLTWGTLVGLDVVTVPQSMISRPVIAGTVTGIIIALLNPVPGASGAVLTGMLVGGTLELYALDVLPFGASRYPDYGPATVAAVYTATDWPRPEVGLGVGVLVGLLTAVLGGWMMQVVRRANAQAIQKRAAALSAGETEAIRALQWGGIRRDIARSAGVTACGIAIAFLIWPLIPPGTDNFLWLSLMAVAGGISAGISGALRSAGRTRRLVWVVAGVVVGGMIVVLQ